MGNGTSVVESDVVSSQGPSLRARRRHASPDCDVHKQLMYLFSRSSCFVPATCDYFSFFLKKKNFFPLRRVLA